MTALDPATAVTDKRDDAPLAALADEVAGLSPGPRRTRIGAHRHVGVWLAAGWLGLVVGAALLADQLPLSGYDRLVDLPPRSPIGVRSSELLGTDGFGRSMLSRLVYGARQSLIIGLVAATIAAAVGTTIGVVAGYRRGRIDAAIRLVLDVQLAFPGLVLLLAIASIGRRDVSTVVISLSILGVPSFARVTRSKTLSLADREFVLAARSMGATHTRIMFREILPNVVPLLSSVMFLVLAAFVIAEGSLSFLGLGIPPPRPSWGGMIEQGRTSLRTSPHLILVPSTCLVLTVMSFRVLGEWLAVRIGAVDGMRR